MDIIYDIYPVINNKFIKNFINEQNYNVLDSFYN